MAEEVKATCPVCEHEVGTKEDGTKIKAHKVSGEKCLGSDEMVPDAETAPEGIAKGDPFEALDSAQDDEQTTDDENDPETPTEPETGAQGVASSSVPEFVHTVKVANPCPYLAEGWWHVENRKMATRAAQQAGHTLAGGEARFTQAEEQGSHILVHYAVPVK